MIENSYNTQSNSLVPMAGIGPATSPLPRECSTTEPHGRLYSLPKAFLTQGILNHRHSKSLVTGAGDEVRTRDILLGRQVLYQLSYTRAYAEHSWETQPSRLSFANYAYRLLLFGGGGWIRTSVLRENGFTVRRL